MISLASEIGVLRRLCCSSDGQWPCCSSGCQCCFSVVAVAQAVSVCFSGLAVSQTLGVDLLAVLLLGRSVFFQYFRGVEVPVHSQVSPRNILGGQTGTTPDSTPTLHILLTVFIPRPTYVPIISSSKICPRNPL